MTTMIRNTFRYTLLIAGVLFTLILTQCSDDDPNDIGNANLGEIRARVNQNVFSANGENASAFLFNDVLTIVGINDSNSEQIILTSGNVITTGVIDLSGNNLMTNGSYMINGEPAFNSTADGGGGSLEITILNTENQFISGSFEFTGTRPDGGMDEEGNVTNESQFIASGSFNALDLQFSIPNNPDNTFSAMVDGQSFISTAVQARAVTTGGITTISIIALDTENEQSISLSIPLETTGNQNFDTFPALGNITGQYKADVFDSSTSTIFSAAGAINIMQNNVESRSMSGTFQFIGTDFTGTSQNEFEITEGSFSIFY